MSQSFVQQRLKTIENTIEFATSLELATCFQVAFVPCWEWSKEIGNGARRVETKNKSGPLLVCMNVLAKEKLEDLQDAVQQKGK
jgi:hypothetical protein